MGNGVVLPDLQVPSSDAVVLYAHATAHIQHIVVCISLNFDIYNCVLLFVLICYLVILVCHFLPIIIK